MPPFQPHTSTPTLISPSPSLSPNSGITKLSEVPLVWLPTQVYTDGLLRCYYYLSMYLTP